MKGATGAPIMGHDCYPRSGAGTDQITGSARNLLSFGGGMRIRSTIERKGYEDVKKASTGHYDKGALYVHAGFQPV